MPANRDELEWNGRRFDITRDARAAPSSQPGAHACAGQELGAVGAQPEFLRALIARVGRPELAGPAGVDAEQHHPQAQPGAVAPGRFVLSRHGVGSRQIAQAAD